MRHTDRLLTLALLALAGCAGLARDATVDDRAGYVAEVLHAHGFAPPMSVRTADSSVWIIGSRPGETNARMVDLIVVRLSDHALTPTVEIRRYVQGPTDWAILGTLLGGDETTDEARSIRDELERHLTPG